MSDHTPGPFRWPAGLRRSSTSDRRSDRPSVRRFDARPPGCPDRLRGKGIARCVSDGRPPCRPLRSPAGSLIWRLAISIELPIRSPHQKQARRPGCTCIRSWCEVFTKMERLDGFSHRWAPSIRTCSSRRGSSRSTLPTGGGCRRSCHLAPDRESSTRTARRIAQQPQQELVGLGVDHDPPDPTLDRRQRRQGHRHRRPDRSRLRPAS